MNIEVIESDMPTKPGLYRMSSASAYHKDPLPEPSLSSSIIKILQKSTPLHAWWVSPRMNPDWKDWDDEKLNRMDFGSAVHKLTLGYGDDIEIVQANDWRSGDAKAARANARKMHRIPLLQKDFDEADAMAASLTPKVEEWLECPIDEALREVVVVWQQKGMWRRSMIDAMRRDLMKVCDVKTTEVSCNPAKLMRFVYDQHYHIQAAHYSNGLDALDPENAGRRQFGFAFGEASEPYITGPIITLDEAGKEIGRKICARAAETWDACVKAGPDPIHWRGYELGPYVAIPPPWMADVTMEWERE